MTVFVLHGQYPCLLLTWCELVAEGLPGEAQVVVGYFVADGVCHGVDVTVANISQNDTDAVTVLSLIVDGEFVQLAVECEVLAFHDFASCQDGVVNVGIVLEWREVDHGRLVFREIIVFRRIKVFVEVRTGFVHLVAWCNGFPCVVEGDITTLFDFVSM